MNRKQAERVSSGEWASERRDQEAARSRHLADSCPEPVRQPLGRRTVTDPQTGAQLTWTEVQKGEWYCTRGTVIKLGKWGFSVRAPDGRMINSPRPGYGKLDEALVAATHYATR